MICTEFKRLYTKNLFKLGFDIKGWKDFWSSVSSIFMYEHELMMAFQSIIMRAKIFWTLDLKCNVEKIFSSKIYTNLHKNAWYRRPWITLLFYATLKIYIYLVMDEVSAFAEIWNCEALANSVPLYSWSLI